MGYDHLDVALAVVVQAMVSADVAGVMFTANPITGAEDELVVTASYGVGEAVVGGLVTPDTFVLDRRGKVRSRTLGTKERRVVLAGGELEPSLTCGAPRSSSAPVFALAECSRHRTTSSSCDSRNSVRSRGASLRRSAAQSSVGVALTPRSWWPVHAARAGSPRPGVSLRA
jgi:hypothetical protein